MKRSSKPSNRPPLSRRSFRDAADEAEYVHHKLRYWLAMSSPRARPFARRMLTLAQRAGVQLEDSILGNECLAHAAEALHDWPRQAKHLSRVANLVQRLIRSGDVATRTRIWTPVQRMWLYLSIAEALLKAGELEGARKAFARAKALGVPRKKWEGDYLRVHLYPVQNAKSNAHTRTGSQRVV